MKRLPQYTTLVVAWVATLLASSLAIIFWKELAGAVPDWLPWTHAIGLLTIFFITFFVSEFKGLRWYVGILVVIFFLGFGGGWDWGLIPE